MPSKKLRGQDTSLGASIEGKSAGEVHMRPAQEPERRSAGLECKQSTTHSVSSQSESCMQEQLTSCTELQRSVSAVLCAGATGDEAGCSEAPCACRHDKFLPSCPAKTTWELGQQSDFSTLPLPKRLL